MSEHLFPLRPGLYWAAVPPKDVVGRRTSDPPSAYNAIVDVSGTPPFLRVIPLIVGGAGEFEPAAPCILENPERVRFGPELEIPACSV